MATYTTNGGSFAVSSVRQWSPSGLRTLVFSPISIFHQMGSESLR